MIGNDKQTVLSRREVTYFDMMTVTTIMGCNLLWLKGQFALARIKTVFRRDALPFAGPTAASSTLREPAQTLCCPAAAPGWVTPTNRAVTI